MIKAKTKFIIACILIIMLTCCPGSKQTTLNIENEIQTIKADITSRLDLNNKILSDKNNE